MSRSRLGDVVAAAVVVTQRLLRIHHRADGSQAYAVLGQYYPTHPPNRTTTALYDFAHAILQNTLNILG